jgi:hypothetical protein
MEISSETLHGLLEYHARSRVRGWVRAQFSETLWACAWADWAEEAGELPAGCEITEVMPKIPRSAEDAADRLYERFCEADPMFGFKLIATMVRDGSDMPTLCHYLAMEAMGHGVSYSDDHSEHGIAMPSEVEVMSFDGREMMMSL